MGDTENSLQSKKRGALREISRDNPGLDDEEDSEQEGGTFKKASEEVLATRRIVSVRRKPKAAPAPNPFAGIKLVAPTLSAPINLEAPIEKKPAEEKTVSNDPDSKTEKGEEEEEEKEKEVCKEPEEERKKTENDVETEAESKAEEKSEEEKPEKSEEKKEEDEEKAPPPPPLNSFQQLSSGQNAFTNLSGTGFSTSTFSFGPIKTDGSGFGSGLGSLFGPKPDGSPSPFGLNINNNNGTSSLFGSSISGSSSSAAKTSEAPAPMKEVEVETGEENEEAVFSADSILYEFTSTGWKERGKGEVKINVSKVEKEKEKEKARLVMRARGNYRLILNANVFPDMKFEAMDKKGLSFACLNSTGEGSGGFSTFALKFRDCSIVEDFRSAVAAHRGKNAAPAVLKTPENSPKASDE